MEKENNTEKTTKEPKGVPAMLRKRSYVMLALFLLVGCGALIARLYYLQIVEHEKYQVQVATQQLKDTAIAPKRGQIFDANGKVLAKSSIVWNITADPSQIKALKLEKEELKKMGGEESEESREQRRLDRIAKTSSDVAGILGLEYEEIYNKLSASDKQYVILAKQVDKPVADRIQEYAKENMLPISVTQDTKREYPYGAFASSVLGFMHADGYGFYGLEKQYETELAGTPGRLLSLRSSLGNEVANDDRLEYSPKHGNNIVTTLHVEIQQVAEKYLENSVKANNVTERGTVIVMDVNTGEIYAMATKPDFDPNDPKAIYDPQRAALLNDNLSDEDYVRIQGEERQRQWRNKAITDLYMPGSVFKVITVASALDAGTMNLSTSYLCKGGGYSVGPRTYNCAGHHVHGWVDADRILYYSCNQGVIQAAQGMGREAFSEYYNGFGFTEPTGIDLPAEQQIRPGVSYHPLETMTEVDLASTSFGQAISVTPLQMATAISAAVNGGYLVQPHVVSKIVDQDGNLVKEFNPAPKRQVISEEVSEQVRGLLEHVVDYGKPGSGGGNAYVAGYHIGGKSGTTEKLDKPRREVDGDYEKVSSFAAVVPVNDPQIVVLALLDEPHADTDYGSMLSAPLAGNIISEIAPYLGLETDPALLPEGDVMVPDLVNATNPEWDMAQVTLNRKGLTHRRIGNGPTVLAQYPAPGARVPGGTTVYLYTDSAEIRSVPVPNVVGKKLSLASQILNGAGLNMKQEGAADGVVTAQDQPADQQVPMGTVVTLTVEESQPEPPPSEDPPATDAPPEGQEPAE